jgi:DNA-binding LytR/AlgR family response regulator
MLQPFFIRCDGKYIRIDIRDIRYLESLKNYVRIVTITKTYLVLMSMQQLEEELPQAHFCRVHRSFIVSIGHICSFDHESVYMDAVTIPISPVYKNALQNKVKVLVSNTRTRTNTDSVSKQ